MGTENDREILTYLLTYDVSNHYNVLKELSNLENRVSPNPRIRGTVYLRNYLYKHAMN